MDLSQGLYRLLPCLGKGRQHGDAGRQIVDHLEPKLLPGPGLPAVLTVEEAKRLLAASEDHPNVRTAFRNRAIIAVLLYCGLRRAEVLGLGIGDVDLKSSWLKVRRGKGVKDRLIPMVPAVAEIIADWLEFRPEVGHDYLLTGREGKPLSVKGVVRAFELVKRRAGLVREGVTLHTLRHTFASLLLQGGCDLVSIKGNAGARGPGDDLNLPTRLRAAPAGGGGAASTFDRDPGRGAVALSFR